MTAPLQTKAASQRAVALIGLTLALSYVVVLAGAMLQGQWLLDPGGQPIAGDFVNVWAAGDLARSGHAADAYDWTLHKAAEVRAVGHDFANYYGWHYPPTFLFVATVLAVLPYTAALLVWLTITLPGYLAVMRGAMADRAGIWLGLGFPAALWNVTAGQNGFLTASLIGGTLLLLERRPVLAGVCLGLLTYKPQFGLLFPVVLAAAGYWRVLLWAAITAGAMALASLVAFGIVPWIAFVQGLGQTSDAVLAQGLADIDRLQSVFGAVRAGGGDMSVAWAAQAATTAALLIALCALWRSRAPYALKAAALAAGALLATPYLYIYDLVVLAVPTAFFLREALPDLRPAEMLALCAAGALILAFPYLKTQVGLAAVLIVAALIARRAVPARNVALQ